jgi:hypothetical protein
MVGPRWELDAREHVSALQVCLKLIITSGKERTGDAHPIINDWGEA